MDDISINKQYITEKKRLTEKEMLLGILWEGDLELHTNMEKMKSNPFGERILHGDSITAILFGLLQKELPNSDIVEFISDYKQPVYIGDTIWGSFDLKEINEQLMCFQFEGLKENGTVISSGTVKLTSKGAK